MKKAFSSSLTYFHTADKVDSPTSGICEIAAIPSHLVSGLVNPKSLSCKGIYLSFDCQKEYKLALSDDELNCELELKIGELLKLLHKNNHFLEDDVKLFKTALCSLIHQNIAKRHQDIREKVDDYTFPLQRIKSSVSFKKIIKELRKNYRIQDNNYWNLVCRQNFEMAYTEKLADLEYLLNNSCIDFDLYVQYQSNLELLRTDVIEQYLPNDCVEFLKKIYPYCIRTNLIDHQYYTAISEPLKIKNIFLDFFQKVNKPSYKLTLKCSKNIYVYQPTCIDFNENDDHLKNIAINRVRKGLAENIGSPFLVDINVDYMVVKSSRADDEIPTGIEKITDVEGYVSSIPRLKNSDKFTERKEIYFVDSRKALGEING